MRGFAGRGWQVGYLGLLVLREHDVEGGDVEDVRVE